MPPRNGLDTTPIVNISSWKVEAFHTHLISSPLYTSCQGLLITVQGAYWETLVAI